MKIYDFSGNDFGIEYMTENDHVSTTDVFDYKGQDSIRVIVSNRKDKRLVFILPCKEIIQNKGFTNEEAKKIINHTFELQEDLYESIDEAALLEGMDSDEED